MKTNVKMKQEDDLEVQSQMKESLVSNSEEDIFKINSHQRKLERQKDKEKEKSYSKKKIFGESARRLRLLRDVLGLTAAEMAINCKINPSKYTRLENALTQLTKHDATCICISVLKNFQLIIEPEWLILKISQTPASLINTRQVQQKVQEYTENVLDNTKNASGSGSTVGISLEMEYLSRIYDKDKLGITKFIMVNDNRLFPVYQKGDYVGGIVVPKELWYCLKNGYACIVELKKDQRVMVRNVYLAGEYMEDYLILGTNTRDPELVPKDSILSIAAIFYHRYNSEELAGLLDLVQQHSEKKQENKE